MMRIPVIYLCLLVACSSLQPQSPKPTENLPSEKKVEQVPKQLTFKKPNSVKLGKNFFLLKSTVPPNLKFKKIDFSSHNCKPCQTDINGDGKMEIAGFFGKGKNIDLLFYGLEDIEFSNPIFWTKTETEYAEWFSIEQIKNKSLFRIDYGNGSGWGDSIVILGGPNPKELLRYGSEECWGLITDINGAGNILIQISGAAKGPKIENVSYSLEKGVEAVRFEFDPQSGKLLRTKNIRDRDKVESSEACNGIWPKYDGKF